MNWWNLVEMYKSFSYFSIFFKKSLDYNTTRCVPLNSLFISSSKFICVIIIELTKLNKNEFPLTLKPKSYETGFSGRFLFKHFFKLINITKMNFA